MSFEKLGVGGGGWWWWWVHLDYNVSSGPFFEFWISYWAWTRTRTRAWQFVVSYCITTDWTQLIEVDRRTGWFWRTGYSLLCTVNTGIITKVKLAPSPRAFLTVEELFTFHISPRPTSSRLSKQTERVSGALKINDRTFIKQQKV